MVRLRSAELEPGPRPPSKSGRVQSTMTRAGSKSYLEPRPLQAGHAPEGGLKMEERGSSWGTGKAQSGEGRFLGKKGGLSAAMGTGARAGAGVGAGGGDCSRAART